ELIAEARDRHRRTMLMWGNQIAKLRLTSYFSPRGMLDELARGASYYRFLTELTNQAKKEPDSIAAKLKEIFQTIFRSGSLTVGLTAPPDKYSQLQNHITQMLEELPQGTTQPARHTFEEHQGNEGLILPTQVQFVAKGYNYRRLGQEFSGELSVLKTLLDYGYLWDRVRVQGGAYGCFPMIERDGTFVLVSFRDPNLEQTLGVYDQVPDFLAGFSPAENVLGMKVEERDVIIDELDEFKEAGACGTAAVITPIGAITHKDKEHIFYSKEEVGPVTKKLYETLVGIQTGDIEAPEGWVFKV
ncbi:MAG: hypothetical protein R6U59_01540, partial [Eubacteriales bacterium]